MHHSSRSFPILPILLLFVLTFSAEAHASDTVEEVLGEVQVAMADGDDEKVARLLFKALHLDDDQHYFDDDKRLAARQMAAIYALKTWDAARKRAGDDGACKALTAIADAGEAFRPTVKEAKKYEPFQSWPAVYLMVSACYSEENNASLAQFYYEEFLKYKSVKWADKDEIETLRMMVKTNLDALTTSSDPYAVGNYVTNVGSFQDWIGRVTERKKSSVVVRVTYGASESKWNRKVGDEVTFLEDEIKRLDAVSINAAVTGWQ